MTILVNQIIPYYPDKLLFDDIINNGTSQWILYIDLRNIMQGLYLKHVVKELAKPQHNFVDTSISSSLFAFLSFHAKFAKTLGKKIGFVFFYESGTSSYHSHIMKEYKQNAWGNFYDLSEEEKERYLYVITSNLNLLEKVIVKIPNVVCIHLDSIEADFIPYYLMSRGLVPNSNTSHIIYSNDKDMFQCLHLSKHCYIFRRIARKKEIITHGNACSRYFKFMCDFPDSYFQLALSLDGDSSDNISGVNGIGPVYLRKHLRKLVECGGGIDNIVSKAYRQEKRLLCQSLYNGQVDSRTQRVFNFDNLGLLSRNMSLISYEVLSRHLDNDDDSDVISARNAIKEAIYYNKKMSFTSLYTATSRLGIEKASELAYLYSFN